MAAELDFMRPEPRRVRQARNRTDNFLVNFDNRVRGEKADLVAATNNIRSNSENCPNAGVGIDVTDKTLEAATKSSAHENETCVVWGSSSPTPISKPCKVKMDKATVESMAISTSKEKCKNVYPLSECPKRGLANPGFAVARVGKHKGQQGM